MIAAADITGDGVPFYTRAELEVMTKQQLLEICSVRGINVGSGSLKADIVNAVLENQGNEVI